MALNEDICERCGEKMVGILLLRHTVYECSKCSQTPPANEIEASGYMTKDAVLSILTKSIRKVSKVEQVWDEGLIINFGADYFISNHSGMYEKGDKGCKGYEVVYA